MNFNRYGGAILEATFAIAFLTWALVKANDFSRVTQAVSDTVTGGLKAIWRT